MSVTSDINNVQIDDLVADREAFNEFVYTPISQALKELRERQNNKEIQQPDDLPDPVKKGAKAVLFRQLMTPNHEVLRFLGVVDALGIDPLLFEYLDDKFTSNNDWKYYLGRKAYFKGMNSINQPMIDCVSIVDFAKFDGKKIRDVQTLWGEPLVDFHHRVLHSKSPLYSNLIYDGSEWLKEKGEGAKDYYKRFLQFFIKNGILFENFLLDDKEKKFNSEVFLPAFIAVYKMYGVKPLIAPLEPTEIEGSDFWMYHPYEHKIFVQDFIASHAPYRKTSQILQNKSDT
jgi:hypothetical protein